MIRAFFILLVAAPFAQAQDSAALRLSAAIQWPKTYLDYAAGSAIAARTGKPLVTFVGYQPRDVRDAIVCYTPKLKGFPEKCVVISSPTNAVLYWKATLRGISRPPTDAEIDKEVEPYRTQTFKIEPYVPGKVVAPNAVPFAEREGKTIAGPRYKTIKRKM